MTTAAPHQPVCPFCLSAILPSEDSVVCSACGILHHRECWRFNRKCATYGCTGVARRVPPGSFAEAWHPADRLDLPSTSLPDDTELQPPPPHQPTDPPPEGDADDSLLEVYVPPSGGTLSPVWVVLLIIALPILMALALTYTPRDAPTPPPAPQAAQGSHGLPPPPPPPPGQQPRSLSPPPPPPGAAPPAPWQPSLPRLVIAHAVLRSSPGDASGMVNRLYPGAVVDVVSILGQWAYVRTPSGDKGYVHREALAAIPGPSPPAGDRSGLH